jgi:hypothetical protein
MKRTNRLPLRGEVMIKILGTLQSRRREKLSDTIDLAHMIRIALGTYRRLAHQLLSQSSSSEESICYFSARKFTGSEGVKQLFRFALGNPDFSL